MCNVCTAYSTVARILPRCQLIHNYSWSDNGSGNHMSWLLVITLNMYGKHPWCMPIEQIGMLCYSTGCLETLYTSLLAIYS